MDCVDLTMRTSAGSGKLSWTGRTQNSRKLGVRADLMAIINVTPDSFSDGGLYSDPQNAYDQALAAVEAGASYLDVGGESTRPGSESVGADEELRRVVPVVKRLRSLNVPISIDTSKAVVARAALEAGASIINDVTAGRDPEMFAVAADFEAPVILMHMQGTPADMQVRPQYADVVEEVSAYLCERMAVAQKHSVKDEAILLDPGIGFGKTLEQNLTLLQSIEQIERRTGRPLLIGLSRKSFLPLFMNRTCEANERDAWSHYFHGALADQCDILRVHDVQGAVETLRVQALFKGSES